MKKIFFFILAAAAIVASCAKEPISEPVSPSGGVISISATGTYKLPTLSNNITISGVEGVVFDCTGDSKSSIASIPNGATFRSTRQDNPEDSTQTAPVV